MSINPSTKGKRKVYEPPTRPTEPVHDWEKDEEELDLEARLFGGSRKGKSKGLVDSRDDLERSGLESVDDDEVGTGRILTGEIVADMDGFSYLRLMRLYTRGALDRVPVGWTNMMRKKKEENRM
jgi:hypothetical protein